MAQKILLVDDEEGIRKVLSISLADSGYEVYVAENGQEALDIFQKTEPPIVLTDIKMPGMDGIELLQRLKEEEPDTEVIMITGHGDMELAIQSLKSDATDFITKPINEDVLQIALKRANERIDFKRQIKEHTENLERLVEEKTHKLIEAEKLAAVGQTVAGLAHAIKNVTGGLTGGAYVLEKGLELNNEKYLRDGWEMVKENVVRTKRLAMDLLSFAKDKPPDYRLCDPNALAREVASLMSSQAERHGITILTELDETLSTVWMDPEAIHRCLMDLVSNAIDACTETSTSEGPAEVTIKSMKPEGWGVAYEVIDTGCGMDQETRRRVFKRFFSTKGSRGTGLGLMMTKKIIDEHRGVIEVASEKGKGSRFTIRLPHREDSPG